MDPAAPAFFERDGDAFVPRSIAGSPWSPDMMHGRLLAGLAARSTEHDHGDPTLHVTRLTVDLFRSPPMEPVRVETRRVRDGNRIRVVDASVHCAGVEVARASAVMLRKAEQPPGTVWTAPAWDAPHPDELPRPEYRGGHGWLPPWDTRPITPGGFGALEQKRTWLRENRELVEGEPLSAFVRVAVAADYANPFANSGDQGLQFINADITLYLHRLPADEWLGFEVQGHGSADGVAVGACTLYDTSGPIGHSTVCAVANRRLRPG